MSVFISNINSETLILKFFLIFLFIVPQEIRAQTLSPCDAAYDLGRANSCVDSTWQVSGEIWFMFIADSSYHQIILHNSIDTTDGHAHAIILYEGSCSSPNVIAFDTLSSPADFLVIDTNIFIPGSIYFIQVLSDKPFCEKGCSINPLKFTLCISRSPVIVAQNNCPFPLCGANLIPNPDFETQGPVFCTTLAGSVVYAVPPITNLVLITGGPPNAPGCQFGLFQKTNEYAVCNGAVGPFLASSAYPTMNIDHTSNSPTNFFFYGDPPSNICPQTECVVPWENVALHYDNIPVTLNAHYKFSMWIKQLGNLNLPPAVLKVYINNILFTTVSAVGNAWLQESFCWIADACTADVKIVCQGDFDGSGYDFGIDDLEFGNIFMPAPFINPFTASICPGESAQLVGGYPCNVSYSWSPSAGLSCSTCQSVTAFPTATTSYSVIVTSNTGCSVTQTVVVNVLSGPSASFAVTNNESCMGNLITLSNLSTGGLNYEFHWNDNSPPTVFNKFTPFSVTHTYQKPGQYTASLIVTSANGCCDHFFETVSISPDFAGYNSGCCTFVFPGYATDQSPDDFSFTITGDVNGLPGLFIRDTIFITNNAIVTLNGGATYQFGPWGKIIVDRGATLILDNVILDGLLSCGTMWQGIEVWGTENKSHSPADLAFQGKLIMFNSARIKNAHNGALLGRFCREPEPVFCPNFSERIPQCRGPYVGGYGGGHLTASGLSHFTSCANNILVAPYPFFSNGGRVFNCSFDGGFLLDPGYSTTNTLYTYPDAHNIHYPVANPLQRTVNFGKLWRNRNFLFQDNVFKNSETAIELYNAQCRIIRGTGLGNDFLAHNQAIRGFYYNSLLYSNRIIDNEYNLVSLFNIDMYGSRTDIIKLNDFNNNTLQPSLGGVGLFSSSNYRILDNIINRMNTGIAGLQSGAGGGLIGYENTGNIINKCATGTLTGSDNSNLQIRCNIYDNTNSLSYLFNWNIFGVLASQGTWPIVSTTDPTGNQFDPLNPIPLKHIRSNTNTFTYYRHDNSLICGQCIDPDISQTIVPITVVQPNNNVIHDNTSCLPPPCPCPPLCCYPQRISTYDSLLLVLNAELAGVLAGIDGGQTQVLLDAINSFMPPGQLKNLLLSHSPLSDEVLLALLELDLPPGILKEILIPNSPVSDEVRPALLVKLGSLPPGISNLVRFAQGSNQYRTVTAIQRESASKKVLRQAAANDLLHYYAETEDFAGAVNFLESENTTDARQLLVSYYLENGDHVNAASKLASLAPSNPDEQAFADLHYMLLELDTSGKTVFDMSPTQEQLVRSIAAMYPRGLAAVQALSILKLVFNEEPPVDLLLSSPPLRLNPEVSAQTVMPGGNNYLQWVFYNAADAACYAGYYLPENSGGLLEIIDLNGKKVALYYLKEGSQVQRIECSALSSGLYLVRLTIDGKIRESKKISITR